MGCCYAPTLVSPEYRAYSQFLNSNNSGVSHIRLIDFDMVTLSSLNRHAVATLADVGVPKVTACKQFFERVAPWVEVDARVELWKLEAGGKDLLEWGGSQVDWVIGQ